jgi:hypothetical protein
MDLWRRPIHKKPLVNLIRGADDAEQPKLCLRTTAKQ